MARRVPDISKIQRLIGYRPVLDLPEMLERVIAYERERSEEAEEVSKRTTSL
jgi:nucleoside-diphosphate-sugar epimerase